MAEGAFRAAAEKAGLDCVVDSAGTAAYHIGEAPDPRAINTAKGNGVNIAPLLGRQLSREDFYTFSHIFALDAANLAGIEVLKPRDATAKTALMLDVLDDRKGEAVKDPYYGDESDFAAVWDEVNGASQALVNALLKDGVDAEF